MSIFKKIAVVSISAATAFGGLVNSTPLVIQAAEDTGVQNGAASAAKGDTDNVVFVTFADGLQGKITFLEDGIFRYNVDPTGTFSNYASPRSASHTGRIQQYPDTSENYSHPAAAISETDTDLVITAGTTTILFDKASGKMTVKSGDKVVLTEKEALSIGGSTSQILEKTEGADFYGGGTQNGRMVHTGNTIAIANTNNWVDGGVASPNPFYWSTEGYGVMRNTFAQGSYDFGNTEAGTVKTTHSEREFDAYYFVSDAETKSELAADMLQGYYHVTGNPVLLPEYGFYLGHLNCYNRDGWGDTSTSGSKGWTIKGSESAETGTGTTLYESGRASGYIIPETLDAETLNGERPTLNTENFKAGGTDRKYSAQAVLDKYADNDMPFGWFVPNDGYGCGYGQNGYYVEGGTTEERLAVVQANAENLGRFTQYANAHGVSTGLWTQSNLTPIASEKQHLQRDFESEVLTGGISSLKTDVAWVGSGYSFGLNGLVKAYNIATEKGGVRPNFISLDGWAGTQRLTAIWSGDQYGGNWEYIRFHIPTFIGQSMSGNPNAGSDMDGIFGGAPIIATRDYQWKTFISSMLDMDGWGTYVKSPHTHGDPYTGISRMYLKLKAQLMPYIYTSAASAANIDTGNKDTGLPMIRAMALVDDSDYAASNNTMYQYMFGDSFLVAPVYQDTQMDEDGNDIRNDIFLPGDENDVWIDYFTGDQYRGGQVINNFDAPLWKLPLFVRNGAIIPMYEENNNPQPITETNPDGLDKTQRLVEFYPMGETEYTLYEDDGSTTSNTITEDEEYGPISNISYNGNVLTHFTSKVDEAAKTATLTAEPSEGTYNGYDANRNTQFSVSVSAKPSGVQINGKAGTEAASLEAFNALGDDEEGWFYDEAPVVHTYAHEDEDFSKQTFVNSPKVYVKFAKTNVNENACTAVVEGFVNDGELGSDSLNEALGVPTLTVNEDAKTPTSITLNWNAVEGAEYYEIMADGVLNNANDALTYTQSNLEYDSEHTYKVRARNADGYSAWSEELTTRTLLDPWRNVPFPENVSWSGKIYGSHNADLAFDHIFQGGDGGFHSNNGGINDVMTIDYGKIYAFEKLEYYPRDDAGNGTVTKMDIAYSIDGVTWTELPQQVWARNAEMKEVELNAPARYIRLIPRESVGTFFAASEIAVYKKDGTSAFVLGSNLMKEEITDADYSNMKNYLGLEDKEPTAATFQAQIRDHYADINNNGVYDVYDYSYTMAGLDGGTKRTGDVSGILFFDANKTAENTKAGDIVTVSVMGSGIKNANALGGLFRFNNDDFEFVQAAGTSGVEASGYLATMEDLSRTTSFNDGTSTVNIAFANRGDKALFNGSVEVARFELKAKKDGASLDLNQTTMLVGPTGSSIQGVTSHDVEIPEVPSMVSRNLGLSDLTVTMTNEFYPTDDGTNVTNLIQQGKYDGLFNGANEPSNRDFELLWSNNSKFSDKVTVPLTINFAVNEPKTVDSIKLVTGAVTSNGRLVKHNAVATFTDGTEQTWSGGVYDTTVTHYEYPIAEENLGKELANFELNIEETGGAQGNQNLTLAEIEFKVTEGVEITDITLADSNATKILTGDLSQINASIVPAEANNQYWTAESSNPEVASITAVQNGDDVAFFVKGVSAGKATITLTAAGNTEVTRSYEIEVSDEIDTAALEASLNKLKAYPADMLTAASLQARDAAVAEAEALLAGDYDRKSVVAMAAKLDEVLAGLTFRAPVAEELINKTADTEVSITGFSSQCEPEKLEDGLAANLLDKDTETYWHSDYVYSVGMPQWVTFDLGKEYTLTDVAFMPRVAGYNGDIFTAEILVGDSAEALNSVGVFNFEIGENGYQLADRTSWKNMTFAPVKGRYVQFKVHHAGGDTAMDAFCSASEVQFYGTTNEVPEPVVTNKTLLNRAIAYAEAQKEAPEYANVNSIVKNYFESALEEAKAVAADEAATQEEVDAAWAKLADAVHYLGFTSDKGALGVLVAECTDIRENIADYEGDTEAFLAALSKAEEVLASDTALDESIQKAYDELLAAKNALKEKSPEEIDTSVLELLVAECDATDLSKYIRDGQDEFKAALEEAKAVLADPQSQKQVDEATAKLHVAYMNLRLKADESIIESLKSFVDLYENADPSKFTEEEWNMITEAYDAVVEGLLANDFGNLDQDRGAELKKLADAARDVLTRVDKSALRELHESLKDLEEEDYASGWNEFKTAHDNAFAFINNDAATQEEVDAAHAALKDAHAALVTVKNVSELKAAINDATTRNENIYTADSWKAMQEALKAAQDVDAKGHNATQEEIDTAAKNLKEALANLVLAEQPPVVTVDTSKLEEAIKKADALNKDEYTEDSWNNLTEALDKARGVAADPKSQEAVDQALADLNSAMENLKKTDTSTPETPASKDDLQKEVDNAKKTDKTKYTDDTVKKLEEAIARAENVLADKDASQEDVDAALKDLKAAVAGLKKKDTGKPGTSTTTKPSKTDGNKTAAGLGAAGFMGMFAAAGAALVAGFKRRKK